MVFTKSGNKLAASARSIKGFDVYEALESCSDTIEQFGGHMYAAGLTLLEENYEAFKSKFEEVVANTMDPNLMSPEIMIDAIIRLDQITPKLMRIIKQFAPFGPGNMTPVFMAENLHDTGYVKVVGQEGKHLKCKLFDKNNGSRRSAIDAIGFNLGKYLPTLLNNPVSAVFTLDENEWQGNIALQMKLRDIKELNSYQF